MEAQNSQPQTAKSDMDKHGRIIIPAALRHALNYNPGDTLVMRVINGELHIVSIEQLIKSTQDLIQATRKDYDSGVEELIKNRREEEAKENMRYGI